MIKKLILIIVLVVFVVIIMGLLAYKFRKTGFFSLNSPTPTSTGEGAILDEENTDPDYYTKSSRAVAYIPDKQNTESVMIDFASCDPGSQVVYFGSGSTMFVFEGVMDDHCVFSYQIEVENPGEDTKNNKRCYVPVTLGQREYKNGFGVQLKDLDAYCGSPKGS